MGEKDKTPRRLTLMMENARTVLATFPTREMAERAVSELRGKGFDREISVVAKEDRQENKQTQREQEGNLNMGRGVEETGDNTLAGGTTTGGVLGGLAGLAAGAGALAIPGIGPIIAAGPIAGLLSGAAAGGIAGGLIDWGIPVERGRYFEDKVKQGSVLVSVRAAGQKADQAAEVLRQLGAQDVEAH